ncbi:hypothetical protein KKB18_02045 [bacterium]|nr:hypothetical protein [bacterium]
MTVHQEIVCEKCNCPDFDYDSSWKEYSCACCGWVVEDKEKISNIEKNSKAKLNSPQNITEKTLLKKDSDRALKNNYRTFEAFKDKEKDSFGLGISVIENIGLFFCFIIGGWAFILLQVILYIPLLMIGFIVYLPIISRLKAFPHKQLTVKCDVCDQPAVGYKEIKATSGFLNTYTYYHGKGFLCNFHTREYVDRANSLNLKGIFLSVGGFAHLRQYFRTHVQSQLNLQIVPKSAGQPGIDSHLDMASKLCEKAKSIKDWQYVEEFADRAFLDAKTNEQENEEKVGCSMLCKGIAIAAQEKLERASKETSLNYLQKAQHNIQEGLGIVRKFGTTDKIVNTASTALKEIESRRQKITRRWW